ncbi:hypothetical protein CF342_07235 [Pseudomonas aeruginosa]|nr:hypothetical protein [Pseudomonas aeruginosa]MBA4976663.1 hypothetical protein [Pseudomonas aeruginosa]MBA4976674.1 hypothetical protein [Pseudomonas aeruginosa]MCM5670515.1 hypothetical protein [Pseudomonas aeruginosa]MDI3650925.1 hypothetical protein [Pseudomonas aeruginosa]OXT77287.1 hypothetical protein CF342_07235 [Pseudomonas aeruginosa]
MEWMLFVLVTLGSQRETHLIDGFATQEACMQAGQEIGQEIVKAWRSVDAMPKAEFVVSCKRIRKS